MKYIITIEYDGSKYNGLQKLKNKVTVQGELETLLSKLDEKPVSVKASGRTDKGVHALNQTCHFELAKKIRFLLSKLAKRTIVRPRNTAETRPDGDNGACYTWEHRRTLPP